ncbi:FAD-dependent monooxygenase [Aliiglaciecola lipolytica]|uniref:Protein visC n=1 Tax=Aliiglaciecola lipolytica E3 TaxID=1127673 RepID=K6YNL2_9ALTE|nr:FAD-dependent monooxygenase [Aliiglaciecola lipolytica]GAC12920.1 protein visC [Aliiglaciecola lipolytica E3]
MFDVAIVGGGMVGAAAGIGLAQQGLNVVIFESVLPSPFSPEQSPDMRVSAINLHSQSLLESLGVWSEIEKMRLCPFTQMQVWEDEKALTRFDCAELNQNQLGFIIENRLIQLALFNRIKMLQNITVVTEKTIKSVSEGAVISIQTLDDELFESKVLIGADGGHSQIRNLLKIGSQGWQYQQHAMGINIKMVDSQQQNITWQQFTPSGPRAFLPLYGDFASLVWYDSAERISELTRLNHSNLKAQIVANFPQKLADFDILQVASFPLTRMHATRYCKNNTVLIGDAAHTINPLAGQGVNLGFSDVQVLLNNMQGWDKDVISVAALLKRYESIRKPQNLLMMSTMDAIYATFSNNIFPLKVLRNAGLKLADKAGPLKKQVMKVALGLT